MTKNLDYLILLE